MLVLRHAERLPLSDFGATLDVLYADVLPRIKVHVVLFCSALSPLPLRLEQSPRSLLQVTLRHTCHPIDFYDVFMGKVLANNELPVLFPRKVINWLHEKFWRSTCCVRGTLDRIALTLGCHFEHRRSMLAMFDNMQWIHDMRLPVGRFSKDKDENMTKAVTLLLAFMDARDLEGTGLSTAFNVETVRRGLPFLCTVVV